MKKIRLTQGYVAYIDDEDFDRVSRHSWVVHFNGKMKYAKAFVGSGTIELHRFIMGEATIGTEVDHIDHDGLNCQKSNMRFVTHGVNRQNARKADDKTSKFLGVCRVYGYKKKWRVRIKKDYSMRFVAYFDDELEAAKAYDEAALEIYGEHANTNKKMGLM